MLLPSVVLYAIAACQVPELSEHSAFAIGDRGFAIAAVVQAAEREGFAGVVLAADGGEVVAVVPTGTGEGAIRADTLFEIASVTKQFTSAAVLTLVQEGRLALDDSIAEHLPGVPEDCRGITVRHLLQHTSGIPGTNSRGGGDHLEPVLPVFLQGGPKHEPGTHWEYWNQGYALLSEVIARAADEPYTDYLKRAVFEPAGMTSTVFTGDAAPEGVPVALGRSGTGQSRTALEHPYGSYGFQYRGMGGVASNAWDLWRWDRALHTEGVLTEASKRDLFEPGLNDYALGWFVREGPDGLVHQHGGGVRGFSAELRRYPNRGALIVVLCSNDRYRSATLVRELELALFGRKAIRGEGGEIFASLVGRYTGEKGTVLVVEPGAVGNSLRARIVWGRGGFPDTRAMITESDGVLVLNDGHTTPRIAPIVSDGVVIELTIDPDGLPMRFKRETE